MQKQLNMQQLFQSKYNTKYYKSRILNKAMLSYCLKNSIITVDQYIELCGNWNIPTSEYLIRKYNNGYKISILLEQLGKSSRQYLVNNFPKLEIVKEIVGETEEEFVEKHLKCDFNVKDFDLDNKIGNKNIKSLQGPYLTLTADNEEQFNKQINRFIRICRYHDI